jgi:chromosome segregation ATPase
MAQLAALASSVAVVRKELDKLDEAIKQQVLSASALRQQLAAGAQQQLQLQAKSCSLRSQLQEGEEELSDLSSWAEVLEKQLSTQRAAVHTSQVCLNETVVSLCRRPSIVSSTKIACPPAGGRHHTACCSSEAGGGF